MLRQLNSTAHPLSFFMTRCGKAAPGLVPLPLASLSKDGGPFAPALGTVIEQGRGWYALLGHAQDRNTLGSLIIDAVASDPEVICLDAPVYEIVNYDPYQGQPQSVSVTDATVAAKLDTTNSLLQRLVTAERA